MNEEYRKFFAPGGAGHAWWQQLTADDAGRIANKADRAALRRCNSADDVALTESYARLWSSAKKAELNVRADGLAAVAGLLAHVELNRGTNFGEAMAKGGEDSKKAPVSGLRFRKLLETKESDGLYLTLLRVTRLLGRQLPVEAFAADILEWHNDSERVRKRWARDYYTTNTDEP